MEAVNATIGSVGGSRGISCGTGSANRTKNEQRELVQKSMDGSSKAILSLADVLISSSC